jgi:Ni,Fe-hydrogenase III large subunit
MSRSNGEGGRSAARPAGILWAGNAEAVPLADVPCVPAADFADLAVELCSRGCRLSVLCALAEGGPPAANAPGMLAVLADDQEARLGLVRTELPDRRDYPALAGRLPQAQAFEREIYETTRLVPAGHPWLKPLRRHGDLESLAGRERGGPPHPFFRVEGAGIHEVAVGPVHAGIIEPGHFRFQCHGEIVLHLEIQLGYQHRAAEELLLRSTPARRLAIAESIAGDTAVGHATAYAGAVEALAGLEAPLGAQSMRGIALELERVANHVGDLGALCNDVGYLPGASWLGRWRGEFLNLLLELSGNRYGRGLVRPGGVRFGLASPRRAAWRERLRRAGQRVRESVELIFETASVVARFEHTGVVPAATADDLGLVGPAARASGRDRDVRRDHPSGIFRFAHIPVALAETGDVLARAQVRWLEIQRSIEFVEEQLGEMADDTGAGAVPALRPECVVVSMVEGWRGEITHVAFTSRQGGLVGYKIVDPSFHNWLGLAMAMRGGQISDFPLCNKSFNLSYAGHDL